MAPRETNRFNSHVDDNVAAFNARLTAKLAERNFPARNSSTPTHQENTRPATNNEMPDRDLGFSFQRAAQTQTKVTEQSRATQLNESKWGSNTGGRADTVMSDDSTPAPAFLRGGNEEEPASNASLEEARAFQASVSKSRFRSNAAKSEGDKICGRTDFPSQSSSRGRNTDTGPLFTNQDARSSNHAAQSFGSGRRLSDTFSPSGRSNDYSPSGSTHRSRGSSAQHERPGLSYQSMRPNMAQSLYDSYDPAASARSRQAEMEKRIADNERKRAAMAAACEASPPSRESSQTSFATAASETDQKDRPSVNTGERGSRAPPNVDAPRPTNNATQQQETSAPRMPKVTFDMDNMNLNEKTVNEAKSASKSESAEASRSNKAAIDAIAERFKQRAAEIAAAASPSKSTASPNPARTLSQPPQGQQASRGGSVDQSDRSTTRNKHSEPSPSPSATNTNSQTPTQSANRAWDDLSSIYRPASTETRPASDGKARPQNTQKSPQSPESFVDSSDQASETRRAAPEPRGTSQQAPQGLVDNAAAFLNSARKGLDSTKANQAPPPKTATQPKDDTPNEEHVQFFQGWKTPEPRSGPPARPRRVKLLNLPSNYFPRHIFHLVHGGRVETISYTRGNMTAYVTFTSPEAAKSFADSAANGIPVPAGEASGGPSAPPRTIFVELEPQVMPVGGNLATALSKDITRVVRAVGVDKSLTQAHITAKATEDKTVKIEHVSMRELPGSKQRCVEFRTCSLQDAIKLCSRLRRDWEECNMTYAHDPCEVATGPRFSK